MEWIALRQITIVYILCATTWFGCLILEEPDCGIPIRSYCVYYLFFRMFRNVHNGIGALLHLNDTPFYYKPNARLLIFLTFELFEFLWLLYGQYLFYFSKSNTCNQSETMQDQRNKVATLSHNFLYITMLLLTYLGLLAIINFICVIHELILNYYVIFVQKIKNYNHQVTILRSVSKVKYRTGLYHH